ncbi:2-amino-3,7-dideoxy-D-threo-hept-6-ulosonate synthase [Actinophytocola sp.]|uniref:2-amino-3,7-dideoxy-D-threo-hept-6-ulosonate synthase n=1 Tax=Actinophytocola sp. TaxID=1872138 RepID=UPI002ED2F0C8
MSSIGAFGRQVRLRRLYRHDDHRLLVVPLDHGVTDGPIAVGRSLNHLIGQLADNGADAVVLHKGTARRVDPGWFSRMSLIVHLSASTRFAPDPDAKYLVASVEEAVCLGAGAVSVHVNLGSREEARQIADLAAVGAACDRWNMPLLAMMYLRGPEIDDPRDPAWVAHAAALAADLGADLVKTVHVGSPERMVEVTRACPVPVLVAGGPRAGTTAEFLKSVAWGLRGGAAGVAVGRNIFQAPDPGQLTRELCALVHPGSGSGHDDVAEPVQVAAG